MAERKGEGRDDAWQGVERNFRLMRQFSINDAMSCAAKWINRIRRGEGDEYEGAACAQRSGLSAGERRGERERGRYYLVAGHAAEAECIECCFIKAAQAGQGKDEGQGGEARRRCPRSCLHFQSLS